MGGPTILVVEDEKEVLDVMGDALRREGFRVQTSRSGATCLDMARTQRPDVILLDLILPDLDGIEVCRQLKWNPKTRSIPVVMVTAKVDESDVVLGLGIGADDYICKPFRLKELIARVKVVLRRARGEPGATNRRVLDHGPLRIDLERHELVVDGTAIKVTPTQLKLLHLLALYPGVVHTREQLIAHLGQVEGEVTPRIIDVHVQVIRRKLGSRRDLIDTVRGVGYALRATGDPGSR